MNLGAAAAVLYLTTPTALGLGQRPLRSLLYINFSKLLYYGEIMDAIPAAAAHLPCKRIKAISQAGYGSGAWSNSLLGLQGSINVKNVAATL